LISSTLEWGEDPLQQRVDDAGQFVSRSRNGFCQSSPCSNPPEERPQRAFATLQILRGQPQRLRRAVHARAGRTRLHFASRLFWIRGQSSPTANVLLTRPPAHIRANLAQ